MMGHRGCRLAVTYPEIAKMQTKAVIRAAINVKKAHPDWNMVPEIMIPLVCEVKELKNVKEVVVETADAEIAAAGSDLKYSVGTMIEIPRAALTADEIATEAEFFCFGTNDLTQMTFGFSRDDSGKFLNAYYQAKIFESDPIRKIRPERCWKINGYGCKTWKTDTSGHALRNLWRARWRSIFRRVLPQVRIRLCILLTIPCADRKISSSSGSYQQQIIHCR